ncbi:hypothetical protein [Actinomadura sp. NEAU-AAG7]|uniref:hypothetical protein n=1 Tax=Actinomadura sp. NEAU-AAG7 TaxID=2839640 RepID=UPI001BE438C8|nr:hypothetical protein [Actinomadura sp. NEAU-AAG7]MBT2208893.1 hypothetical protein [Actinomadura sp. NEAU-AAG7]
MSDAVKVISAEAERHPEGYFYLAERIATVRADLAPSAAAVDALISARLLLVPLMAPDDPETAELMARLGSVFLDRCDAANSVLAAEAVRWTRRAIEAMGAEHPRSWGPPRSTPVTRRNWRKPPELARVLVCLFEVNGDLAVVDEAAEQYALCLT